MYDKAYCATNVSEESVSTQEPSEFLNLISVETTKRMPVIWMLILSTITGFTGKNQAFYPLYLLGNIIRSQPRENIMWAQIEHTPF